jgi:hypothetical protein
MLVSVSIFHTWEKTCDLCLSEPDLFHLTWCSPVPSKEVKYYKYDIVWEIQWNKSILTPTGNERWWEKWVVGWIQWKYCVHMYVNAK